METKHEASMARTLRAEQHKNTEAHYQDGRRSLKTKMFFIAFCFLLIGDLCGGAWVYYHGPKVGGWDSFGSKSYAQLIEEHDEDVATHDEDVRLHVIDVRLHDENVIKHALVVKDQRKLADDLAVLEHQNTWLWHSHNVFKAVLHDDESFLLKGGAWEFAKKHWPQAELSFVAESFHKSALAESETAFNNREAHQQNKLLFMSSLVWDNVDELARVRLSDLPPGWVEDYPKLFERLKKINATNVLEHLDSKRIGVDAAAVGDHPLGGGR